MPQPLAASGFLSTVLASVSGAQVLIGSAGARDPWVERREKCKRTESKETCLYQGPRVQKTPGFSWRWLRRLCGLLVLATAWGLTAAPTHADFKLCNTTSSRVGVAIGSKDVKGWTSEGWWNVASHSCETLLKGVLIDRYYYIHAIDYDRVGEWGGNFYMCTGDKSFTIRNTTDCEKRGYKREGFFEVDTGKARDWTVRLTDEGPGRTSEALREFGHDVREPSDASPSGADDLGDLKDLSTLD